ncbi:MAG: hypothetical protein M1409_04580 [Actinobacteria bacterium]|nr:hypothetical protein [Actinomycetota bacterium]
MKAIKKNKKFIKILILTGIYAILSVVISTLVIYHINNSIITNTDDSPINNSGTTQTEIVSNEKSTIESNNTPITIDNSATTESADTNNTLKIKLTNIPWNAINISFSYDGKYCAYLCDNKIYIKDIASNTTIKEIIDDAPVTNFILINDRDQIIYFTLRGTTLNVKTYDISSNTETLQKTIKIPEDATIKHIDYSALTNLVFLNVENGSGSSLKSALYYLNIMKRLKTVQLKTIINNMVLLNNAFTLYYEDYDNILYCYPQPIKSIEGLDFKKTRLLGCDSTDNVFIQSLNNRHNIYILKNGSIDNIINLNDLAYNEFYADKIGVYVIYSNYIINLAGDINKKMLLDRNLLFVGAGGDKMYFRDSDGNIIAKIIKFE